MLVLDFFLHLLARQQEKDRDGCPKIVNLGTSKTDLFYERKKYGFKQR
jgi:PHD finger-like domain-containing protein 5A